MKSGDRRLRKEKGEVREQEIEERYGEVKSRDRRLRKAKGKVTQMSDSIHAVRRTGFQLVLNMICICIQVVFKKIWNK